MRARFVRAIAVTLLAGLALLLGAAPALAHTRLQSSDPTDGASLDSAPEQVALTFNEPMSPEFSTITVIGPDGQTNYQDGAVTAEGGTISTRLLPLGPAGRYEIGYRVVSADGHPVTGSVAFTLTTPGPGAASAPAESSAGPSAAPASPAPPAASEDEGGAPVWPWVVGAVVLVGAGVVVALRLGRG
ncbi:copper resistance CopC family protein [Pseudonocardia sp. MH-G8]|uniref:copper resistance CopC family protein n=1 Tax=Pseudonocardia sp. MH-G8 TaxID=1854588 RepID=UPI000BA09D07|nr:copper resistance CopC family protein [Pseudonocardia sp. MH-G8]OZM82375.1 copper resistance protein CopC [Pseudonocardia sp. MH-G8]